MYLPGSNNRKFSAWHILTLSFNMTGKYCFPTMFHLKRDPKIYLKDHHKVRGDNLPYTDDHSERNFYSSLSLLWSPAESWNGNACCYFYVIRRWNPAALQYTVQGHNVTDHILICSAPFVYPKAEGRLYTIDPGTDHRRKRISNSQNSWYIRSRPLYLDLIYSISRSRLDIDVCNNKFLY